MRQMMTSPKKSIGIYTENMLDQIRLTETLGKKYRIEILGGLKAIFDFWKKDTSRYIIIDIDSQNFDFNFLKEFCTQNPEISKKLIGYYQHVQIKKKIFAEVCGIKQLFQRSNFFIHLLETIQNFL